jgi:hypothetical protein
MSIAAELSPLGDHLSLPVGKSQAVMPLLLSERLKESFRVFFFFFKYALWRIEGPAYPGEHGVRAPYVALQIAFPPHMNALASMRLAY